MNLPTRLAEIQVKYHPHKDFSKSVQITSSESASKAILSVWDKNTIAYQEAFLVLFLNRRNSVLGYRWISHGGISGTFVDVRHVFGVALKCNATSVILAHNHPSGTLSASQQDIALTRKLKEAGKLLDILYQLHLFRQRNPQAHLHQIF